jgi:ferritin-like protein
MSSTDYHEPLDLLSSDTQDMHRALVSAIEELEAIDWYQQRADACKDDELRRILLHNKNEEIEHFLMTLEWIRRKTPRMSDEMRWSLFSEGEITAVEEEATSGDGEAEPSASEGALGIGDIKRRANERRDPAV